MPQRVRQIRERIASAAVRSGRSATSVTLLAVAKAQPAETVRTAAGHGLREFGESYLDEALGKLAALEDLPLTWHFIGRLQANKTRPVAERFAWVHGIDRLRIAQRLSQQRPFHAPALQVCIQVNLAAESTKGGVAPQELPALAAQVAALPHLTLRGLMCLPPRDEHPDRQRQWFAKLRRLQEQLNDGGLHLDTLSMGMSADYESAILEGATVVRIGTALFGPRPAKA